MAVRGGDSGAGTATRSAGEPAYPIFNTGTGDWGDFIPILAQNHL